MQALFFSFIALSRLGSIQISLSFLYFFHLLSVASYNFSFLADSRLEICVSPAVTLHVPWSCFPQARGGLVWIPEWKAAGIQQSLTEGISLKSYQDALQVVLAPSCRWVRQADPQETEPCHVTAASPDSTAVPRAWTPPVLMAQMQTHLMSSEDLPQSDAGKPGASCSSIWQMPVQLEACAPAEHQSDVPTPGAMLLAAASWAVALQLD